MINPLAISVTLGGLLLDVLVPRPKPQVGAVYESLPSTSRFRLEDNLGGTRAQHERPLVASGAPH